MRNASFEDPLRPPAHRHLASAPKPLQSAPAFSLTRAGYLGKLESADEDAVHPFYASGRGAIGARPITKCAKSELSIAIPIVQNDPRRVGGVINVVVATGAAVSMVNALAGGEAMGQ